MNVLKELSCEIDNFIRTIEGKKFATKEDVQEIEKWSDEVEAKISEVDDHVLHLGKWLKNFSGKIARGSENESWNISGHSSKLVKIPKWVVSGKIPRPSRGYSGELWRKFSDWIRSEVAEVGYNYIQWHVSRLAAILGKYSKVTDKLSFASKFSYLRELLAPKVRTSIEALRFSPEGYNRTKSILMDE